MTANRTPRDLALTHRRAGLQASSRTAADLRRTAGGDLATVDGRDTLVQAILDRLLTRRGELAGLGHPGYGSRLHELIGEPDSPRTRGWAEVHVRECLDQERRLAEVLSVRFQTTTRAGRSVLSIDLVARPSFDPEPIRVALDLDLGS